MKTNLFYSTVLAGTLLALGSATRAETLNLDQLPNAVQQRINAARGSAEVTSVEKITRNGQVLYEVALNEAGDKQPQHLYITENGDLVNPESAPPRTPMSNVTKVVFNQLPMPVFSSIQNLAGASFIEKLEKGALGERTAYQAVFERGGKKVEIRLWEDGTLVNDRVNNGFVAAYQKEWAKFVASGVGAPPPSETSTGTASSTVEPRPTNSR